MQGVNIGLLEFAFNEPLQNAFKLIGVDRAEYGLAPLLILFYREYHKWA